MPSDISAACVANAAYVTYFIIHFQQLVDTKASSLPAEHLPGGCRCPPQSQSIPAGLVLGLRQFASVKPEGHAQAFWEIRLLVLRESGKPGPRLSSVTEPASCARGCWGCLASMDSKARGERQGRESIREEELELVTRKVLSRLSQVQACVCSLQRKAPSLVCSALARLTCVAGVR